MQKNQSPVLKTILTHFCLLALSLLFVAPLIWMLSTSLKLEKNTMGPPQWIPDPFVWTNFRDAINHGKEEFGYSPFLVYARNSVIIALLSVGGAVISNCLVAYSFARLKWRGREAFFALTLTTMMVPFPVLMVPTFSLFKWLGWVGTFKPLWVPLFFGSAFSIFLLRQFFLTIPFELSEAAKIDGAGEFRIFSDILLPLSKPAIAVVALFTLMCAWNDFLGPMIYLVDQKTFTLALGLQAYQTQHGGTPWNLLMAATLMVILPILVVFFFAQKLFLQGIATSGLK